MCCPNLKNARHDIQHSMRGPTARRRCRRRRHHHRRFFLVFFFFLCSGGQVQVRDERVRQGVPTGEDVRRGGALQCKRRPASGAVLRCQISPRPPTPQGLTVPAQSALAHATVCLRQYCTAYNTGTGTEYWHSSRYWHSRILVQQYGTGPAV